MGIVSFAVFWCVWFVIFMLFNAGIASIGLASVFAAGTMAALSEE